VAAVTRHPGEGDSQVAVAGLAREVDGLRRDVHRLRELPERVDELARLLGQLTDTVSALSARPAPSSAPSWLLAPADDAAVRRLLDELAAWLETVYLRYPDAAQALPDCWLWHPDVVEELVCLMHAWCAAYQGRGASVALAADWHDRLRPGAVRRIRQQAGACSPEAHLTRDGWKSLSTAAPEVPGADAIPTVAAWWGTRRDQPAPEPATTTAPKNGAHR
jgi:hypothetical protein